jgi:hypothetical protein
MERGVVEVGLWLYHVVIAVSNNDEEECLIVMQT